eukprot:325071-Chlamydomonas_euryale.AAC.6
MRSAGVAVRGPDGGRPRTAVCSSTAGSNAAQCHYLNTVLAFHACVETGTHQGATFCRASRGCD